MYKDLNNRIDAYTAASSLLAAAYAAFFSIIIKEQPMVSLSLQLLLVD